ncbi:hCG1818190 [Homo sapiens]|nr:hCG1818190 [Homo sapiens]
MGPQPLRALSLPPEEALSMVPGARPQACLEATTSGV